MNWKIAVGVVAIVSGAAGSVAGYFFAKTQLEKKYAEELNREIEVTKEFYRKLYKADDYETPEKAVSVLAPAAAQALRNYRSAFQEVDEGKEFAETVVKNIFEDDGSTDEIPIQEKRNRTEEAPYILEKDEYMASDLNYTQSTVTYYAGDGVLTDSREDIIEDVDMTVGEDNLKRFGHGSGDAKVVYVRNDRLEIDFEILKSEGKYSKEVAGLGD